MINSHITPALGNRLPYPLRKPILDQAGKNHQILGHRQQLITNLLPGTVGGAAELALCENVLLPTDASDCPEEKRADVVGDGGRERVEVLGVLADGWNGGLRVQREKAQSVDQLWGREGRSV